MAEARVESVFEGKARTQAFLRPRTPDRVGRGAMLALLVHAGLIAGLSLAVSWRTHSEPEGSDAELWAAVPQVAAPPAAPSPVPQPEAPEVKPEPPKPVQPPPEPVVKKTAPPPEEREAEIAEQKERKAKELKAKQEAEKKKAEKLEKDRAEKERVDKLAKEKAEKQKAEQAKAEEARVAKAREDNLKRMQSQLGGNGAPGSTGKDARSAGPSAGYAGRIKARVKPNITFTDEIDGNPTADVEVRAASDGTITGKRLVKSSGNKAWDDAVLRAVEKTEVLPKDTDGSVPSPIVISFRPRDF